MLQSGRVSGKGNLGRQIGKGQGWGSGAIPRSDLGQGGSQGQWDLPVPPITCVLCGHFSQSFNSILSTHSQELTGSPWPWTFYPPASLVNSQLRPQQTFSSVLSLNHKEGKHHRPMRAVSTPPSPLLGVLIATDADCPPWPLDSIVPRGYSRPFLLKIPNLAPVTSANIYLLYWEHLYPKNSLNCPLFT